MTSKRDLWLTARFLSTPEGAAAQREMNDLPGAARAVAMAAGDRLAEASALLAQQYYRQAVRAWSTLGREGFARWIALGEDLALAEPSCREGALVYFGLSPATLGSAGVDALAAWCGIGRQLLAVSRKLAAIFFETTASLIGLEGVIGRLQRWIEVALELYSQHGWQGEFLAQAYLAAAPAPVLELHPDAYRLWAALGVALYPVVKERSVFGGLPAGLPEWTDDERESFLQATLAVAGVTAKQARTFYYGVPPALERLAPVERQLLLRALRKGARQIAGTVGEIVPVLGTLVRQIPPGNRITALRLLGDMAERFPHALVVTLRALPRVYEEADPARVEHWFATGSSLAAENAMAGMAYFALESRTSLRVLRAGSTAVGLEEAQGVLRKYVQMLSGKPTSLRGLDRVRLLLPLEEFPEENEVSVPLRIDLFDTYEDNFRLYRLLASQLAGRREYGTYEFVAPDASCGASASSGSLLHRYLAGPDQPELLEPLFLLAEGFRVHCRLAATYRGLAQDGRWAAGHLLRRWRAQSGVGRERLLDALFAFLLAGAEARECPPWLPRRIGALVFVAVAPLAAPDATVQDSVRVAQYLASVLESSGVESVMRDVRSDYVLLDELTGDARLEMLFDEDAADDSPGPALRADSATGAGEDANPDDRLSLQLQQGGEQPDPGAWPLTPEQLKRLLEAGVKLEISQGFGEDVEGIGLYISDLIGKVPAEEIDALRRLLAETDTPRRRPSRRWQEDLTEGEFFYYDEWDYHIEDYRSRWCRLRELNLDGDAGEFFNRVMLDYGSVIPEVRRQFQRIRPEMYRKVRGLEDGEDFDLNAVIEARAELRARHVPSGKLYVSRQREERDVATLFLIDMSASTDEPLGPQTMGGFAAQGAGSGKYRRIVDVTKEALVVMAAALEEIGDAFAIYGFSGHGRNNVEFYRVKAFAEPLNSPVKGRIGEIEPKRSTRMGTALRHAVEKMAAVSARSKHLFLLSDGFPQDHDYGQDRRSNVYGIRDTAVALTEIEAAGIIPFCITVDKAGHDYLRQMCDESRYMVIDDVEALPRELPKIYQRVVRV